MTYPTWKTLTIGTKTKEQLLADLKKNGHQVSDWTMELVDTITFTKHQQTLDLVSLNVSDLGFDHSPTTTEIADKLPSLGLSVVPQETVLYLRLNYTDQPMDVWETCFSEPLEDSVGRRLVLVVARDSDGSWVDGYYANPGLVWRDGDRLLVCRKASVPLESSTLSAPCTLPAELIVNGVVYDRREV